MRLIGITLIGLISLLAACDSPQTHTTGDGGSGSSGNGTMPSGDCSDGPARGPTQSCCPKLGIDACGAGLVCAALDGRNVAVCYAEKSRAPGESCTDDKLCISSSCNMMTQKCRYPAHVLCADAMIGCAPDSNGTATVCASNTPGNPPACWPVGGTMAPCPYCAQNSDCAAWRPSATCIGNVCRAPRGEAVLVSTLCCASGTGSCSSDNFGNTSCYCA